MDLWQPRPIVTRFSAPFPYGAPCKISRIMPSTNPLAGLRCKRMKQISYGKQRETKNGAPEIEVMTHTMLKPPMHPRKEVKGLAEMSKNDQHQASCAEYL